MTEVMNTLEAAAKAGFEFDGVVRWSDLIDEERQIRINELKASLRYLADNPDTITVLSMTKNRDQEHRVRAAWRKLCLGLIGEEV